MAKCLTVGYISPISKEVVLFEKPLASGLAASRHVKALIQRDTRVVTRKQEGSWDEIDNFLYPELRDL